MSICTHSDCGSLCCCHGSTLVGRLVNLQFLDKLEHIAHEDCVETDVDPIDLRLEGCVHPGEIMGDPLLSLEVVLNNLCVCVSVGEGAI